ncbi:DUF1059 domain-containing protein [Agrobacterium vitis]|uniref:DUF1059 domain-containing protein n=1 Tax=Agrobacterium vitis TaxID=373 RepID=A0A6L6V9M9_AGRVI|nr:DUF1059 domain-containing protein [Agrobacterium vitis]MUZ71501.1 DUF1059 domain-containing protein [Agrobacterium vitis]
MKQFECGSLVPGCEWHTRANEEAEVVRSGCRSGQTSQCMINGIIREQA